MENTNLKRILRKIRNVAKSPFFIAVISVLLGIFGSLLANYFTPNFLNNHPIVQFENYKKNIQSLSDQKYLVPWRDIKYPENAEVVNSLDSIITSYSKGKYTDIEKQIAIQILKPMNENDKAVFYSVICNIMYLCDKNDLAKKYLKETEKNAGESLYSKDREILSKLHSGLSHDIFVRELGLPDLARAYIETGICDTYGGETQEYKFKKQYKEYLFKRTNYCVYTIVDQSNRVNFFAITITNPSFNPPLPFSMNEFKVNGRNTFNYNLDEFIKTKLT